MYSLFAFGYALTFGVMGSFNLAHPVVFLTGAYVALLIVKAGHPLWVATLGGCAAGGVAGVILDRVAYWPLRIKDSGGLAPLVSGAAAFALFTGLVSAYIGNTAHTFPAASLQMTKLHFGTIAIGRLDDTAITVVLAAIAAVHILLRSTRLGLAMRAVAENSTAARSVGVNVEAIIAQTMFLASALGALSGIVYFIFSAGPGTSVPTSFQLSAMAVIVLGGLGSLPGTFVAAFAVALVQFETPALFPAWSEFSTFAILLVALALVPRGLIPKRALRPT